MTIEAWVYTLHFVLMMRVHECMQGDSSHLYSTRGFLTCPRAYVPSNISCMPTLKFGQATTHATCRAKSGQKR